MERGRKTRKRPSLLSLSLRSRCRNIKMKFCIFFQVADLLTKVENYTTAIPDSVTESVLNSAGLQSTDVQVEVFLSIKANFYFR